MVNSRIARTAEVQDEVIVVVEVVVVVVTVVKTGRIIVSRMLRVISQLVQKQNRIKQMLRPISLQSRKRVSR